MQDPKRQLNFPSSRSICHCLSNQLLVCCPKTLLSPSYVTVGSFAFRISPIPADFKKPCPPQASLASWAASLHVHVIRGFVADITACISATLQFWEKKRKCYLVVEIVFVLFLVLPDLPAFRMWLIVLLLLGKDLWNCLRKVLILLQLPRNQKVSIATIKEDTSERIFFRFKPCVTCNYSFKKKRYVSV